MAIIAAVARNGIIGAEGGMPWRLATDLKRFRRLTLGKPVIFGRTTFEGLGGPLAGRDVVVVTRQPGYAAPGAAAIAPTLEAAIAEGRKIASASGASEVMIGGGGTIYREAMAFADRLYITHVEASPAGDTGFPPIDPAVWRLVEEEAVPAGPTDTAATRFAVYDRIGT